MAINAGDILTYDGSTWVNRNYIVGELGINTGPVYDFHALSGSTAFAVTHQGSDSIAAFYNASVQQWSIRVAGSNGNFYIRDDSGASPTPFERITITTPGGNVGIGTKTPSSLLHILGAIATAVANKTAAYTVTATDSVVTGDATSAAFTVTLPTAVGITGRHYTIKKIDSSANAVTVGTTSSQTIDGAATYALSTRWQFVTVVSDGANWIIAAK
jgi:hypothetical protein